MSKVPVWFDCDTGVDDATAILLGNKLDVIEYVGISTVAGNVPLEMTTDNTLRILKLGGIKCPVYKGADRPWIKTYEDAKFFHGDNGLGNVELEKSEQQPEPIPAWDGLYHAALRYSGELNIVAVGPLTNIATAISKYPDLKNHVNRIVIMGGSVCSGNSTPCAEFNIYVDPHAAQAVFLSGIPIVMCGLEATMKGYLTDEDIEKIRKRHTKVADFYYDFTRHSYNVLKQLGLPGLHIHDANPLLFIAHPEIFKGEEAAVYVECESEITLGKTVSDVYSDYKFGEKNTFVLLDADREKFAEYIVEALRSY